MMCLFRLCRALCFLCCLGPSMCVKAVELEMNYTDYDNEISQDPEEGDSPPTPCQARELSRWDKLFIALEDSHMRQNMLLESLERCCGDTASLRTQALELAKGTCQQCLPSLEAACRGQAGHTSSRLERGLAGLREEAGGRERRMNATMQQILLGVHEQAARLKRLEEGSMAGSARPLAATDSVTGPMTQRPGGLGAGHGSGGKPLQSTAKEQDVTSPMDITRMVRALVAIATELEAVHVQLSGFVERMG